MEIRPFRGWRYAPTAGKDVSLYLAPPYDVLTGQDKAELLARCRQNIVAVDLPQAQPEKAGPDELYQAAADQLRQWQASGLLRQDRRPAMYVYDQQFTWSGKRYTRRALICGLRATAFGESVLPHEHTFPGPKADRLKLTEHTRMQLSPILGFYHDPQGRVTKQLAAATAGEPDLVGTVEDVAQRLWVVTDETILSNLAEAVADQPAFIADGHHRYTTAMNYAETLRRAGRIDPEHEANFIMFALIAREDPGMLILPTHRIIRNLRADFTMAKLVAACGEFTFRRMAPGEVSPSEMDSALRSMGPGTMALIAAGGSECWTARLRDAQAMRQAAPDCIEPWRRLDVAVLHKLLIDKGLAPWWQEASTIEYTPRSQEVFAAIQRGEAQLGVCLQATSIEEVEAIAHAGATMPHKSTYFYPKLATGLVLKPLE